MKRNILLSLLLSTSVFAAQFTLNLSGNDVKENKTITVELNQDEEGKLLSGQRIDYKDLNSKIKSIKIVTASGLKGTLVDEREIVIYYKTSLNIQGLKIRNLYKVAHTRVYNDETTIDIKFDKDHFQNIVSYLRYHNIGNETIKDIDNLYGSWEEIIIENTDKKKALEDKANITTEIEVIK